MNQLSPPPSSITLNQDDIHRFQTAKQLTIQWLAKCLLAGKPYVYDEEDILPFLRSIDSNGIIPAIFTALKDDGLIEHYEWPPYPEILKRNTGHPITAGSQEAHAAVWWHQMRKTGWKIHSKVLAAATQSPSMSDSTTAQPVSELARQNAAEAASPAELNRKAKQLPTVERVSELINRWTSPIRWECLFEYAEKRATDLGEWQRLCGRRTKLGLERIAGAKEKEPNIGRLSQLDAHLKLVESLIAHLECLDDQGRLKFETVYTKLMDEMVDELLDIEWYIRNRHPSLLGILPDINVAIRNGKSGIDSLVQKMREVLGGLLASPPAGMPEKQTGAGEAVGTTLAIVFLGERTYKPGDGEAVVVTEAAHAIFQAFLKVDLPALDSATIEAKAGYPVRRLKEFRDGNPAFAPFISMPGGKGKGGYRITIRDGAPKSHQ